MSKQTNPHAYSNKMDPDILKNPIGLSNDVMRYHQGQADAYASEILRRCKNPVYGSMVAEALARQVLAAKPQPSNETQESRPDWRETFADSLTNKGGE